MVSYPSLPGSPGSGGLRQAHVVTSGCSPICGLIPSWSMEPSHKVMILDSLCALQVGHYSARVKLGLLQVK